ncbi:MAG TPA: M48 family metalloprotease [Methylibium sp.]|uniref:M48 family metalloprotease n=1 Tax=Methylibium sp. TaxID=2067992 RepID=UPI002DB673CB|nr:M48 family metalloprotease [Methylibium sp.]HEU4458885.1 M48 family metalloprotease [Methylibium sp.]
MASSRTLRRLALASGLVLAAQATGPAWAQAARPENRNNLPALGDTASEDVSVANERRIGDRIMRDIRRDPDYLDDPILLEYMQTMWAELLRSARASGQIPPELDERFAWELFLVRDRTVNAFALPGGYTGIHLGLIAMTASPDELASVVAHELSHITQRHIARSVGASKTTSLVGIAGLILGVLAASRSPDAAQALIVGGQAAAVQGQLNYSRDAEREADRVGFSVLTGAGYAPAGMPAMFEKLLQASRLNDSQNYPYLRSHPLTTERIGDARSRLGVGLFTAPPRPVVHALMQARARVLMDPRDAALQRAQDYDAQAALAAGASTTDRLAALYASALASVLRRDGARAEKALASARALELADASAARELDALALQAALARGDGARSEALLAKLAAQPAEPVAAGTPARGAEAPPASVVARPLLLARAQRALLPDGAAQQRATAERLQTWVAEHPMDATAWGLLASLWEAQSQPLRAARAAAEQRYARGDVSGAVERLRAAQRGTRAASGPDFIEASVIEARLKDLETQRRIFAREERGEP